RQIGAKEPGGGLAIGDGDQRRIRKVGVEHDGVHIEPADVQCDRVGRGRDEPLSRVPRLAEYALDFRLERLAQARHETPGTAPALSVEVDRTTSQKGRAAAVRRK